MHSTRSLLRLILWPTVITLLINATRLVAQLQGWIPAQSGGALSPLGISWLALVFGAWFGWKLRRMDSTPMLKPARLVSALLMAGLIVVVVTQFVGVDQIDRSEAAFANLRAAVLTIVLIAIPLALCTFAIWFRLALTMLLYAIPARLTVIGMTWLAKTNEWDTHYTKFGPSGIERGPEETILSASLAQFGFWIPFTMIAGVFAGCLIAGNRRGN